MPHKHNAGKRHHIPKAKYTVTNWPQYEAGLKQRGSLTLWITPEATDLWKATPLMASSLDFPALSAANAAVLAPLLSIVTASGSPCWLMALRNKRRTAAAS